MKTNLRILFSLLLLFSFILVQTASAQLSSTTETTIEFSQEDSQPPQKKKPAIPKSGLTTTPVLPSVPNSRDLPSSVFYSTLQGASLLLPVEYQPSSIGMSSTIGEVQSFSVTNDSTDSALQYPYFVLDRYFPTEETPKENTSTYFRDPQKAEEYYQYFISQFESRVFYPKSSWEPMEVKKINTEDVLIIRSRYIGQDHHDHYIWAYPTGFFVLTIYYGDKNPVPNTQSIIQGAVESFQLPQSL